MVPGRGPGRYLEALALTRLVLEQVPQPRSLAHSLPQLTAISSRLSLRVQEQPARGARGRGQAQTSQQALVPAPLPTWTQPCLAQGWRHQRQCLKPRRAGPKPAGQLPVRYRGARARRPGQRRRPVPTVWPSRDPSGCQRPAGTCPVSLSGLAGRNPPAPSRPERAKGNICTPPPPPLASRARSISAQGRLHPRPRKSSQRRTAGTEEQAERVPGRRPPGPEPCPRRQRCSRELLQTMSPSPHQAWG